MPTAASRRPSQSPKWQDTGRHGQRHTDPGGNQPRGCDHFLGHKVSYGGEQAETQGHCVILIWGQEEVFGSRSVAEEVTAPMTAAKRKESLLEALARVPDPRGRQGRRYPAASMLALAVCAMACGARSLYAISQWGKEHRKLVCEALGIKRMRTPDGVTLHRLFVRLEVEAFERVLGKWLSQRGLKVGEGIAVDGKTLRGIHGEQLPGVHLISAYAHRKGIVLAQRAAGGKGQELDAVKAVLESLDLKGQIVTGDALLAQRDICQKIREKGGTTFSG